MRQIRDTHSRLIVFHQTRSMENASSNNKMIRTGTVTEVDSDSKTVRVLFEDLDILSDWLQVAQQGDWLPAEDDHVLVIFIPMNDGAGFVLGGLQCQEESDVSET